MTLSLKPLIAATALAACGTVGLAEHSTDAAAAGPRAKTSVSLNTSPQPFGYVKSPTPRACAEGRRIAIFEQLGANQRPRTDRRIATAVTYRYHGRFQWKTKSVDAARLYAKADPMPRCTGRTQQDGQHASARSGRELGHLSRPPPGGGA